RRTSFHYFRFQSPEVLLLLEGTDDAEAHEGRIGVPPNALGLLRIKHAPVFFRAPASCAAQRRSVVIPGPSTNDVRVLPFRWDQHWKQGRCARVEVRVEGLVIVVETPFSSVPVHVVQAPGIRFLLSYGVRFAVGVVDVPGIISQCFRVIAERVGGLGPRTTSILPLRLSWQAVDLPGPG